MGGVIISGYSLCIPSIYINKVGENGIDLLGPKFSCYIVDNGPLSVEVIRIETADDIAGGKTYTFIHGVIYTMIRLAHEFCKARLISLEDIDGPIGGSTVYNNVLDVGVVLGPDTFNAVFNEIPVV